MSHGQPRKARPWYRTWMAIAVALVLLLVLIAFVLEDKYDTDPDVAPIQRIQVLG